VDAKAPKAAVWRHAGGSCKGLQSINGGEVAASLQFSAVSSGVALSNSQSAHQVGRESARCERGHFVRERKQGQR